MKKLFLALGLVVSLGFANPEQQVPYNTLVNIDLEDYKVDPSQSWVAGLLPKKVLKLSPLEDGLEITFVRIFDKNEKECKLMTTANPVGSLETKVTFTDYVPNFDVIKVNKGQTALIGVKGCAGVSVVAAITNKGRFMFKLKN